MKIFLDTANIEDIKKYASWGIIDGVTTNPTLIAKEGISLKDRIKEIAEVVNGPISAEVIGETAEEMIKEAETYAAWHKNIYVKIPTTSEGLKALKALSKKGINTNATLVFTLGQAILLAKAGATLISPFVGRLDDIEEDGMQLIRDIVTTFRNYEIKTKVLVASIRNIRHVTESLLIGADIATIPPQILDELIKHPLTDKGIERFMQDWESVKDKQ